MSDEISYNKEVDKPIFCKICARNGCTTERIFFKQEGYREDGSKKWVVYEYFRPNERHLHKAKASDITTEGQEQQELSTEAESHPLNSDAISPAIAEILSLQQRALSLQQETVEILNKLVDKVDKIGENRFNEGST